MIPLSETAKKEIEGIAFESKEKLSLASGRTKLIEAIIKAVSEAYIIVEQKIADPVKLKELERNVILRAVDRLWISHLSSMTELRTGIGLRSYGQQDPLVEYKKESFRMFNRLLGSINQEIAYSFFKIAVRAVQAQQALQGKTLFERAGAVIASTKPGAVAAAPSVSSEKQVGRNEPCPCGAKKQDGTPVKYKYCHGK
jgi:preprotein translocase subunit SecA